MADSDSSENGSFVVVGEKAGGKPAASAKDKPVDTTMDKSARTSPGSDVEVSKDGTVGVHTEDRSTSSHLNNPEDGWCDIEADDLVKMSAIAIDQHVVGELDILWNKLVAEKIGPNDNRTTRKRKKREIKITLKMMKQEECRRLLLEKERLLTLSAKNEADNKETETKQTDPKSDDASQSESRMTDTSDNGNISAQTQNPATIQKQENLDSPAGGGGSVNVKQDAKLHMSEETSSYPKDEIDDLRVNQATLADLNKDQGKTQSGEETSNREDDSHFADDRNTIMGTKLDERTEEQSSQSVGETGHSKLAEKEIAVSAFKPTHLGLGRGRVRLADMISTQPSPGHATHSPRPMVPIGSTDRSGLTPQDSTAGIHLPPGFSNMHRTLAEHTVDRTSSHLLAEQIYHDSRGGAAHELSRDGQSREVHQNGGAPDRGHLMNASGYKSTDDPQYKAFLDFMLEQERQAAICHMGSTEIDRGNISSVEQTGHSYTYRLNDPSFNEYRDGHNAANRRQTHTAKIGVPVSGQDAILEREKQAALANQPYVSPYENIGRGTVTMSEQDAIMLERERQAAYTNQHYGAPNLVRHDMPMNDHDTIELERVESNARRGNQLSEQDAVMLERERQAALTHQSKGPPTTRRDNQNNFDAYDRLRQTDRMIADPDQQRLNQKAGGAIPKTLKRVDDSEIPSRNPGRDMKQTENLTDEVNSIVVRGFNDISTDILEMFFESKKRSGGGDIKEITVQEVDGSKSATIVFEDPEVAARILSREEPFVLENNTLSVEEPPKIPDVDPCSILVENISPTISKDGLELFFESKKKSGGGDVKEIQYETGSDTAIVTYEEEQVAQRVLLFAKEKKLVHEGCEFQVHPRILNVADVLEPEPEPVDPRIVIVDGIGRSTSKELLEMFLESKKKSGGGDLIDIEYEPGRGSASVTFKDENVALRVLEKPELQLEGALLQVKRPEPEIRQKQPKNAPRRAKSRPQDINDDMSTIHTIAIRGLKSTKKKDLKKFLENSRETGGGKIEDLQWFAETDMALVKFESRKDARSVAQKSSLTFRGVTFRVDPVDTSVADSGRYHGPLAIKVTNISSATKKDVVKLFFKNRKKSGGGDIDNVYWNPDKGTAVITFVSAETVKNVLEKHTAEPLNLTKRLLKISTMDIIVPPTLVVAPKEPCKALIIEAPCVSPGELKAYIQHAPEPKPELTTIMYSFTGRRILVEFKQEPDYTELSLLFVTRPLKDHMMTLQRVALPTQVQVHNIQVSDDTEEMLELYFQDPSHGGDENVEVLKLDEEQKYAVLGCTNHQVVDSIIQKNHVISGQKVQVSRYYPDFGILPLRYDPNQPWDFRPPPYVHPLHPDLNIGAYMREFIGGTKIAQDLIMDVGQDKKLFEIDWKKLTNNGFTVTCHKEHKPDPKGAPWDTLCKHEIDILLSTIAVAKVPTLTDFLKDITEEALAQNNNKEAMVVIEKEQDVVIIVGWEPDVRRIAGVLNAKNSALGDHLLRAKKSVEETLRMKSCQATLFRAIKFQDKIIQSSPNMTVDFPRPTDLVLKGLPSEVQAAKLLVYEEVLNQTISDNIQLAPEKCSLLKSKEIKNQAFSRFRSNNIFAVMEVGNSDVTLHSLRKEDLKQAVSIVANLAMTQAMELQPENVPVLNTEVWQQLQDNLTKKYSGLIRLGIDKNNRQVTVTCLTDIYDDVFEGMKNCFEEHSVLQQFVRLDPGCLRLLEENCKTDIDKLIDQFRSCCVSYQAVKDHNNAGYLVKGTKFGLPQAVSKLTEIASEVFEFDHTISRTGMPQYFRTAKGKEFLESLELKHRISCEIVDAALEEAARERARPSSKSEKQIQEFYKVELHGGFTVKVLQGDITKLKVGAIVNAANADLEHIGGLALAIVQSGGDEIQEECRRYVKRHGSVRPGNVYLGRQSGDLPCQFVIHAVGPTYERNGNNHNKANELYEAAFSSIEAASSEGLRSIALPALSTGIFQYPLKEATRLICEATIDFYKQNPTSSVREVCLVDVIPKTVNTFKQSLVEFIREKKIQTKALPEASPVKRRQRGDSFEEEHISDGEFEMLSEIKHQGAIPKAHKSLALWQRGAKPNVLVTTNGLSVTLKKSTITKEQVDVIVNTSNIQLDLGQGAVSVSILKAAGKVIQDECNEFAPTGVRYGEVVRTSAGKIKGVKSVYHGACDQWDGGKSHSTKILKIFIANCLEAAHQDGHTSIAFPAVGTGNLQFPRQLVSQFMFEVFLSFSQKFPSSSVKDIRVIVYDKDTVTVQAFEDHVKLLTSTSEPSVKKKERFIKSNTTKQKPGNGPSKSVGGDRKSVVVEHQEQNLKFQLGTVTVEVKQGDITEETTDAIVNSTNAVIDFSIGGVSTAIIEKGGRKIEAECQKILQNNGGRIKGHALTSAGNLKSKKVVHMNAQSGDWEKTIRSTLCFADEKKLTSIAFPAVGTGSLGHPPGKMAEIMLKAIMDFTDETPQYLECVRVIIFDPRIFKPFKKEMERILKVDEPGFFQRVGAALGSLFSSSAGDSSPGGKSVESKTITLRIYALSQDTIDTVVKRLEKLCDEETSTMTLDKPDEQEVIKKLTSEQVVEICSLERKFKVQIEVEKKARLNRIHLSGAIKDVGECYKEINNILQSVKKKEEGALQAEQIAKFVQWEYKDGDGGYTSYNKDINFVIQTAYNARKPMAEWEEEDGTEFVVLFDTMMEQRKAKPSSGVPVRKKLLQIPDGSDTLPDEWESMNKADYYKLVALQATDAEYQAVEAGLRKTHAPTSVIKIERVQNPSLYKQYMVKKTHMDGTNPTGHTNERTLYHGTAETTLKNINTMGFNRSYCGKNAVVIGNGVYFARDAAYSASHTYSPPDVNGYKHVYQCKVLTGEYTTGARGIVAPPAKNPQVPNVLFDSVADMTGGNPSVFVIFHDTQAYPEYLITFN